MIHVTCRLTAKNRDQLRNPTLGNRVWASFTFYQQSAITSSNSSHWAVQWGYEAPTTAHELRTKKKVKTYTRGLLVPHRKVHRIGTQTFLVRQHIGRWSAAFIRTELRYLGNISSHNDGYFYLLTCVDVPSLRWPRSANVQKTHNTTT